MYQRSFGPYNKPLLFAFQRKSSSSGGGMLWTMSFAVPDLNLTWVLSVVVDPTAVLYRLPARHSCTIRFNELPNGSLDLEIREPKFCEGQVAAAAADDEDPPEPKQICRCFGGNRECQITDTPDCGPNSTVCLPVYNGEPPP